MRRPLNYLLIPPEPTPNGGLHLGHIAGPFLPCDVLARFVRIRGDYAYVTTAVDSFEPWALQYARSRGLTLNDVIRPNLEKMSQDLAALAIEIDDFVLPHEPDVFAALCREADLVVEELTQCGMLVSHEELRPFSSSTGEALIGPDLSGRCPHCDQPVSGSACESCGGMWSPGQLLDSFAADGSAIEWRQIKQTNLQLPEISSILSHAERTELQPRLLETLMAVRQHRAGRLTVIAPGGEGVTARFNEESDRTPLYSYFAGLVFARYAGKKHNELRGLSGSAFDSASNVVTVNSLGIDNVVSTFGYIDAVHIGLEGYRPYDRVFVNEFYLLDGEKFSTSRNHLVRPAEMELDDPFDRDALRFYLSLQDLSESGQSFSLEDFGQWHHVVLTPLIAPLLDRAVTDESLIQSDSTIDSFLEAWRQLELHIDGARIDLPSAGKVLTQWLAAIAQTDSANISTLLLASTAVLLAPTMPDLAQATWCRAGYNGEASYELLMKRPDLIAVNASNATEETI